jgi:thymidine kinase
MYAGKSTHILGVGAAYCQAGWGVIVARFTGDTRDGDAVSHIVTHDGMRSPRLGGGGECDRGPAEVYNTRALSFAELTAYATALRQRALQAERREPGSRPKRWVVLIDEGQFFQCGGAQAPVCELWALAAAIQGHVWIACLNLDRDLKPWPATRDLATRSVWSRMVYATCGVRGCTAPAWCSHLVRPGTAVGTGQVLVDVAAQPLYQARCTAHMPKLPQLWETPKTPRSQCSATQFVFEALLLCIALLLCHYFGVSGR